MNARIDLHVSNKIQEFFFNNMWAEEKGRKNKIKKLID
jgi:hypothetical protein